MGIQSIIGDVTSQLGNTIQSTLSQINAAVSGLADQVGTFVANIWSGGFAGVSNFDDLKSAVNTYATSIQQTVDEYNPDAEITGTFKGTVEEAIKEYVKSTKDLLNAYVSLVKQWNAELDEAYANYQQGAQGTAASVSADAATVEAQAQSINIG